jgi:hypothetical protein
MSKFTFNRGTWEDGNPLPEWRDDEEFEEYLSRAGYGAYKTTYGDVESSQIEIYSASENSTFYANVSPAGDLCYEVYLPDFPSLMMFLKDYSGIFSNASANSSLQQMLSLQEKLFRANHGHDAYVSCQECDPTGWKIQERAAEERQKRKAEKQ